MSAGTFFAFRQPSRAPGWKVVVYSITILTLLAIIAVCDRHYRFLADDSRFYLVIARHLAAGDGSTINGLFQTNGYHPLWQAIATGLALLSPSQEVLLWLGTIVGYGCIMLTWILGADALGKSAGINGILVFTAVFAFFFIPFGSLIWTEGPLLALLLALLLRETVLHGAARFGRLGMLLGLIFLARLDAIFIIAAFIVFHFKAYRTSRMLISAGIATAFAVPYLASNIVLFGHLMPISGAIKNSYNHGHFLHGRIGIYGIIAVAGALLLGVETLRRWPAGHCAFAALSLGTLLQCAYIVGLTEGDTKWVWYYVPGYLCLAFGAALLLASWPRLARTAFVGGIGVSALCLGAKFFLGWSVYQPGATNPFWRDGLIATMNAIIPGDGRPIFVIDQPGMFAYSSHHPIYAMDGLTSNFALDQEIGDRGMAYQLTRYGRGYMVFPLLPPGKTVTINSVTQTGRSHDQLIHFRAPYSRRDAGCVSLKSDQVLAEAPTEAVIGTGVWGIWRIDGAVTPEICPS